MDTVVDVAGVVVTETLGQMLFTHSVGGFGVELETCCAQSVEAHTKKASAASAETANLLFIGPISSRLIVTLTK